MISRSVEKLRMTALCHFKAMNEGPESDAPFRRGNVRDQEGYPPRVPFSRSDTFASTCRRAPIIAYFGMAIHAALLDRSASSARQQGCTG